MYFFVPSYLSHPLKAYRPRDGDSDDTVFLAPAANCNLFERLAINLTCGSLLAYEITHLEMQKKLYHRYKDIFADIPPAADVSLKLAFAAQLPTEVFQFHTNHLGRFPSAVMPDVKSTDGVLGTQDTLKGAMETYMFSYHTEALAFKTECESGLGALVTAIRDRTVATQRAIAEGEIAVLEHRLAEVRALEEARGQELTALNAKIGQKCKNDDGGDNDWLADAILSFSDETDKMGLESDSDSGDSSPSLPSFGASQRSLPASSQGGGVFASWRNPAAIGNPPATLPPNPPCSLLRQPGFCVKPGGQTFLSVGAGAHGCSTLHEIGQPVPAANESAAMYVELDNYKRRRVA